ncbi:MAG TPA: hypothetical protein VHR88_10140 [Solirubrobacteraceae bacterium]|nr:hypothetical protein [Solirubrobacteraceae bacterium]
MLFAAYAATLGVHAFNRSRFTPTEARTLLTARSIVRDGDVDLTNQYRQRQYAGFYPFRLAPRGHVTRGRLDDPRGPGLPLLLAPAYALAGPTGAQLELAALAALAFVLAIAIARRLVPEPWATAGPLLCGLSPPALAYATAISPQLPAGAALAGAVLLALRARDRPRLAPALGCGALLAVLPWLGTEFLVPLVPVAVALAWWMGRQRRGWYALVGLDVVLASLVAFATANERLYGGVVPEAAGAPLTGAANAGDYLDRVPRLLALWIDRDAGLLRWAPVFALAFVGAWLLWRSRRDRVARAVPDQRNVEAVALVLVLVCAAQVLVALLMPALKGLWFPGRSLVAALPCAGALVAWALRFVPRWLSTVLGGLTLVASAWLLVALRVGDAGWVAPASRAPWGPLEIVFPRYGAGSVYATVVSVLVAAGLVALVANEWRQHRALQGMARRAFLTQR